MTVDPKPHLLGKKPFTPDGRDLLFGRYKTGSPILPKHPGSFGHENLVGSNWGMLGNDQWGDCVFASAGHQVELWTREGGKPTNVSAVQALADYTSVTGFDPGAGPSGNNPTDNGTVIRDALKFRQKTGTLDSHGNRHKIGAYLLLEVENLAQLYEATYLFGAVELGFDCQDDIFDTFNNGLPWRYDANRQIIGGHDVPSVARRYPYIEVVTWGQIQRATAAWYQHRVTEAWAIISSDALNTAGDSLEGFNLAQLQADLSAL